jgi:predicted RNA polymerase sigma factor
VELTGSPVVELNRAVAVSMAFGPEAALPLVDALHESGELERYHLLPGVRGELLSRLGRFAEAQAEYERALEMTANERERAVLAERIKACAEQQA